MECDVPGAIRGGSFEQLDHIPDSIEVNPIADPLQILKNGLECQNLKPHHRSGKACHTHISAYIDKNPHPILRLHLLQKLLNRHRYIWAPEGLPLEGADDILVGLFGQSSEVGERIEEGEFEALHHVGYDRVGLRHREAIEWLNRSRWN